MTQIPIPPKERYLEIDAGGARFAIGAEYDERAWAWRASIRQTAGSRLDELAPPEIVALDAYKCIGLAVAWCCSAVDKRPFPEIRADDQTVARGYFTGCSVTKAKRTDEAT